MSRALGAVTIELVHGAERRTLPASLQGDSIFVNWPMSAPLQFDFRTGAARNRLARRWQIVGTELARITDEVYPQRNSASDR